jgi:thioredoxin 1
MRSLKTPAFVVLPLLCLAAIGRESAAMESIGTYGFVERVKPLSGLVIFRPIGKRFAQHAEVTYYAPSGEAVCKGHVQSVYEEAVYSLADNCGRIEDIRAGSVVGAGGNPEEVTRILRDRADEAEAARQKNARMLAAGDPRVVPTDIAPDRYEDVVVKNRLPVLIEFYAEWCPSARRIKGEVEDLARALAGKMVVVTIDYDVFPEKAEELGVERLPAFIVMNKGAEQERWTGLPAGAGATARRLVGKYAPP